MRKQLWRGLRAVGGWLLIGLAHMDPMALATYQVSIWQSGERA